MFSFFFHTSSKKSIYQTGAAQSCPKRLIKVSNCDDWAMREACDHLGAASLQKWPDLLPLEEAGWSSTSSSDWFSFIKHPSGIFPRADGDCHGCTRLLLWPTEPITPAFVLPCPVIFWPGNVQVFFSGEGNCIVRKISPFLMRGKCKPWQNLISGAKKCSRKWWRDILPF